MSINEENNSATGKSTTDFDGEKAGIVKYRTRKWFIKVFIFMLAVFMVPFLTVIITIFCLPPVYNDTFVGELSEKYNRLKSINEPKIVVIGGSSVAFGLDSEMMEKQLGMEVVNFGLYADFGTKLMMDLSKANINKGDIIILAPEMNDQTLSLYFNPSTALQALDGNWDMISQIDSDNYESLVGASWIFANNKLNYFITGTRPENSGAYKKENFNEYGDNTFDRPFVEMTEVKNFISLNYEADYSDTIETDFEQYVAYVNDYVKYCEGEGATVYFSFCPMNEAAISPKTTSRTIYKFYNELNHELDCKVISNINDYIMDEGYFFDSEFHLNNSGVVVRTVKLIDDIKRELGDSTVTMKLSDLPEPSVYKPDSPYFALEKIGGKKEWAIKGVTELGRAETLLIIPEVISNMPITTIREGSFAGCETLERLEIGSNITVIEAGAFKDAAMLTEISLAENVDAGMISIPSSGLLDGANENLKIYVDTNFSDTFLEDEIWGLYAVNIKSEIKNNFVYEIDRDENNMEFQRIVSVNNNAREKASLIIPDTYLGLPVRTIATDAFIGCNKLLSLTLGVNIEKIENGAFNGATNLTELRIPSSIEPGDISFPVTKTEFYRGTSQALKIYPTWENFKLYKNSASMAVYSDIIATDNEYLDLDYVSDMTGTYWKIAGVLDEGKSVLELTIPSIVDGIPVRVISENAFNGANIKTLNLGEDIASIAGKAFNGAANLVSVYLPLGKAPNDISVPNSMSEFLMTFGANSDLKFYVDPDKFELFSADYFWGDYGAKIMKR